MPLNQVVLYVILLLRMVFAEENNITLSSDNLKTKFGCIPLEKWTLMPLSHNVPTKAIFYKKNFSENKITEFENTISF